MKNKITPLSHDRKPQDLVSIIVPVYNSEQYLRECIASILEQTYDAIELILVDDGSTDHSGALCDEFAQKDCRILVLHQQNSGVSAARNAGMDIANGKYIMFVDSDDTLMKAAVETLLKDAISSHANIVSAVKIYIDADGNRTSRYDDGEICLYHGLESLRLSLDYDRNTYAVHAKLFEREFIKDVRFAEGRKINEDNFFLFECYTSMPVLVQHNVNVYEYHLRDGSASRGGFSEKYLDMLYFANQKKMYIHTHHPELIENARNMEISTHLFFLEVLMRTTDPKYRKLEKDSIRLVRNNYRNYSSKNSHERKMARVVYFKLYPLYKFLVRMKYYR